MDKDGVLKLKQEVIDDFFYYKDQKIAVLNNKFFKKLPEDVLIFAKLVLDEDGVELIEPIEDEEYENVYKTYKLLLKALNEKGEK